MTTLNDKVAVITGGNSGIGLAAATLFIEQGARVVLFGRNQTTLDEAVSKLGPRAVGVQGDVTNFDDLETLKNETAMRFGQIDILFANAGLGVFSPIENIDEASYDKQFDINVKGVFFTVQKLLPLLKNGSSIILTGSAVHEKGVATGSLYFATKAAVRSLSRTLASELAPKGIRVNTLSPGIVRTNFAENTNIASDDFEGFVGMVASQAPLQRPGTMQEIANAARFLASDESSYMTAADLVVDGGWMNV
ncbi:SDR family oxidoreductase [Alteromonas sp. McT4-15]|uniref:SDR family NAD(P)-dependent oxidoreductase n=1 Tax=Alteromonas sp. McT4-15 TaxID=2881256 RepID=UPI001CF8A4E7|nr:SDR family oxidoreductase [Alteromonas sp. McT4-15]MCB4437195.1 SDR family oxidoreductase [Alteromonas sp. McT4-15]